MHSILSIAAAALLCSGAVLGAPLDLEKRAIDQALLDKLGFFAQYAAAAYCPGNNDSPNTKLVCPVGNCPLVEAAETNTVTEFQNSLLTDVTGYVATDKTNKLVVVGFRGSQSLRNFIADADFGLDDTDLCDGCKAHNGFWRSWAEARTGVLAAVKSATAANPDFTLTVVGHSLGGAIADLAAADLRKGGTPAQLVTFGAPRVGNPALSAFITNQQPDAVFRVTHRDDVVPRVPPRFLGYDHISPEFFVASGDDAPPTAADVTRFDGANNNGGDSGGLKIDGNAHGFYFLKVSACNPDDGFEP